VPGIERLARLVPRPQLAVSINATTDAARSATMPVNRAWNLARLRAALDAWELARHERLLFEYVLLAGVNDTPEDADRLAGENPDYHRKHLFEAIRDSDFPSWTLYMQIMPFEEAKTYRFNPFDLTKVWPHGDYPLVRVGTMTLNRNLTDFHTEMEQAAFEPNNLVPGIGLSPDKMLLARGFSYADAHRARLGVNYKQIPVNTPHVPVHSYSKDGVGRTVNASDPVYAPNSYGGPKADPSRTDDAGLWAADGDMVRSAYSPRADDDDFGQARTQVREVLDDDARDRLVSNIAGHLSDDVSDKVLARAFEYWKNVV